MKSLLRNILLILADGDWHSGQVLAERCGVTRTAIWKASKELLALGLELEVVRQQGYRLVHPIELLDITHIKNQFTPAAQQAWQSMQLFSSIHSTNDYLLNHANQLPHHAVCLAEQQTAGRGRRNRAWYAAFGQNLCLSVLWQFNGQVADLAGLSLAVGIEVAHVLQAYGIADIQIKWPNDIYHRGKKLAGILLEVVGNIEGPCAIVLGIGLNVQLPAALAEKIPYPCTDLVTITQQRVSRNHLASLLLNACAALFPHYQQQGFYSYLPQWKQFDMLLDKTIVLQTSQGEIEGIVRGVQAGGELVLETAQGKRAFGSGEVTMKQVMRA